MTTKQAAISITRRLEFDAGHRIPNHDGQCRHLHGHRYAIEVTLTGEVADHPGKADDGMVLDFGDIKNLTNQYVVDLWDHAFLVAKEDKSVILGPIGGTLGITPFNKFMSKMLDDCTDLAKKIKDKEDGYKVSLIDLKNVNQDVYLKILEEYNACK